MSDPSPASLWTLSAALAELSRLRSAIQSHHDTRWTGGRAVLTPPDRALYEAAGVAHRVLGTTEGGDHA